MSQDLHLDISTNQGVPLFPILDGEDPTEPSIEVDKNADAEGDFPEDYEDALSFILGSTGRVPLDPRLPRALEVSRVWGSEILDIQQHTMRPITGEPLSLGDSPFLSDGGRFLCRFENGCGGFVDVADRRFSFSDLIRARLAEARGPQGWEFVVSDDTLVVLEVGAQVWVGRMVNPGRKAVSMLANRLNYPFLAIFLTIVFLGLVAGIVIGTMPPPPEMEFNEVPHYEAFLLQRQPEVKPEPKAAAPSGERAKKAEGKAGRRDGDLEQARASKADMKRQQLDKDIAENAGLVGAMREGSELDAMLGSSALNGAILDGIGGLIGVRGVQMGVNGLGERRGGLGGGGRAVGLGGLDVHGRGPGSDAYARGGDIGPKIEGQIGTVGTPIIMGALDKADIDRVIRRHLSEIKYCYQRELTRDPSLAGKVTERFTIAKDGSVSLASTGSTTLRNSAVESCINGRFMRFQFPMPKGGGIVIVSYPFYFSQG